MNIHFVTLGLSEQVHAQGLGFTSMLFAYVFAASSVEATEVARRFYEARKCKVSRCSGREALHTDLSRFTFPEQIIDLPDEMLQLEYERRGYPTLFRVPGFRSPPVPVN